MSKGTWITIDSVVAAYLIKAKLPDAERYRIWQIAFSGMEEMGLDYFYRINSVKLPVLANKTVKLPDDYLKFTKIGVLNAVGEIIPLKYNNKLTTYAELLPDRISKTQDDTLTQWYKFNTPIWYNYWNGSVFVNLYGLPSGSPFVGSFKVDETNKVILLDENFGYEYLMVEYVATPLPNEGIYYVPLQFRRALEIYLLWQDMDFMPANSHFNLADKRDKRHQYFIELDKARARFSPLYLYDAYQQNLDNQRLTVKV